MPACASSCCAPSARTFPPAAISRGLSRSLARARVETRLDIVVLGASREAGDPIRPIAATVSASASRFRWRAIFAWFQSSRSSVRRPEQRLGQIPGSGGSARLQKIIGITRTKDIVIGCQAHSRRLRLPGGASPPNALPTTSSKLPPTPWSRSCAPSGDSAQRTAKTLLNETEDTNLEAAIELEGHCYSRLRQSDDFREGVEAFHAKRKATFRGS